MGLLDYVVHRLPATRERVRQEILRGQIPRWITNSRRASYIIQVIVSCPPWADRAELKNIQERARQITEMTGVEHHVAHIVPLKHSRMCGLTVPANLAIKTAKVNLAESNHVQLDEQRSLF